MPGHFHHHLQRFAWQLWIIQGDFGNEAGVIPRILETIVTKGQRRNKEGGKLHIELPDNFSAHRTKIYFSLFLARLVSRQQALYTNQELHIRKIQRHDALVR